MKFRKLKANEIEARISKITTKGLRLLLYKDARVDQNLLDETVGNMNWQRSHTRDNSNCVVSIWDEKKAMWVSKEDTGTESRADGSGNEKKGLASDSFKRACFNWGIGRELYSAPFIWINVADCNIKDGKCYDRFDVLNIAYDDNGNINGLSIWNENKKKVVYTMEPTFEDVKQKRISSTKVTALISGCKKKGISISSMLQYFGIDDLGFMTEEQYVKAVNQLESRPDKKD